MVGDERVSRRELLKSGAALRGGLGVGVSVAAALRTEQSPTGVWVLKPDESEIAGKRGSIERSTGLMMSFCTAGREYHGRTCDGLEIQLLASNNGPQPTVDATYRFESSDRKNSCDETFMELSAAFPCQRAPEDDSGSESSASSDSTTTDSGSASTDETGSEPSPSDSGDDSTPTTTESTTTTDSGPDTTTDSDRDTTTESTTTTDSEDDSTPTTESSSDATPVTPESNSDDSEPSSDATESSSDATDSDASESDSERQNTTTTEFDS